MLIIGCDFHTRYQQIAMANDETGELLLERRLDHQSGEALTFYRSLQGPVCVGIEATGPIHWFERLIMIPSVKIQLALRPPAGNPLLLLVDIGLSCG